jgi:hypothetical protein
VQFANYGARNCTMAATATTPTPPDTADQIKQLLAEGPIGLSLAARLFGRFRNNKPTHVSTVSRWINNGVRLADGRVLKLEGFQLNGRVCTTEAAIVRFIAAQQGSPPPRVPTPAGATRTATARRRASEAAAKKLEAAGI